MATFVCIIVLAYSKRQQSQYWIAYTRLYRLFTTPLSSKRKHHARVPPPFETERLYSFARIFNTKHRKRCKNIGGEKFPPFTFNFINTGFEGICDKYARFARGISNVKPMLERCSRFRIVSRYCILEFLKYRSFVVFVERKHIHTSRIARVVNMNIRKNYFRDCIYLNYIYICYTNKWKNFYNFVSIR